VRRSPLFPGLFLCVLLTPAAQAQTSVNPEAVAQVPARNPVTAKQESGVLLEGKGVMDRARPEYDAIGTPVGGLTLYPTLAVSFSGDDNIFRAPANTSDAIFTVSPRLDLRSDWDTDALQLYGQLDHYAYASHDTESRTNWMFGGAGRKDLDAGSFFSGGAYYFDTHEARTSPDLALTALSPTRYARAHADGLATGQFSLLTLSAALNYDRFDFDPTKLVGGGSVNNADRDRNVYQVTGKAAYELAPDQAVFVQFTYDKRDFDQLLDRNGIDRNSDGYRVDVGASMMVTPLVQATGYIGLLQQNHAAPLRDTSTMDFNLKLDWFVTELMTAHLTASRIIDDTTIAGASSVDVRQVGASLDYELLRQFILHPHFDYYDEKFDGVPRDDRITNAGIEARYLLNTNLAVYADYSFQKRDTNASGRAYDDNVITIGIRAQL
jgi:hypothetical protein